MIRLLIIRHGAPDYEHDTLSSQGWLEEHCLAEALKNEKIDKIAVSPFGRAQDTASETIRNTGIRPIVFPWLCEFDQRIPQVQGIDVHEICPWHLSPFVWSKDPETRGPHWKETDTFAGTKFLEQYEKDRLSLEEFLASQGLHREGIGFRIDEEHYYNNETVAFFCHYGRGIVLLSQLLDLPYFVTAHQFWLPTSSVTEVYFERSAFDLGYAIARVTKLGDVRHLTDNGISRCNSAFMMPLNGIKPTQEITDTTAKV